MSSRGLVLLLLTCVCSVGGNLLLRSSVLAAGGFRPSAGNPLGQLLKFAYDPKFVCGFILYGLATLLWFSVISIEDLSVCYPILVSITFVLVAFGSVAFFGERISPQKLIGMAVILAGVLFVARS